MEDVQELCSSQEEPELKVDLKKRSPCRNVLTL